MTDKLTATDATGRSIELAPLDPAGMLDLIEAAGDASSNVGYIRYAMVICSVTAIDGVPVPRPARKSDIRSLASKLGNDGFAAVSQALFGAAEASAANVVDAAKN